MDWKQNLHLADYVMGPLKKILKDTIVNSHGAQDLEEVYSKLTKEEALRRVEKLEEDCKTYADRLEAFGWAEDPARILHTLYRRAEKDPRAR